MPTNLSIIIYVASPIDYARYRHTAIFLEYPTFPPSPASPPTSSLSHSLSSSPPTTTTSTSTCISTTTTLLEIAGGYGFFTFVETPHHILPPSTSPPPIITITKTGTKEIAKIIPLAAIPDSITPGAVRMAVMSTPINNGDMDWNCQNWVGDVLGRLVRKGMLSDEDRERGVDLMVEGVLEARDEWLVEC